MVSSQKTTANELEIKVRNLINQVTNSQYVSPLSITYDNGIYVLRLGLNCKDAAPISFGFEGTEEEFLKFLEKEFKKRKLQNVMYTTGTLINGEGQFLYPIIEL